MLSTQQATQGPRSGDSINSPGSLQSKYPQKKNLRTILEGRTLQNGSLKCIFAAELQYLNSTLGLLGINLHGAEKCRKNCSIRKHKLWNLWPLKFPPKCKSPPQFSSTLPNKRISWCHPGCKMTIFVTHQNGITIVLSHRMCLVVYDLTAVKKRQIPSNTQNAHLV